MMSSIYHPLKQFESRCVLVVTLILVVASLLGLLSTGCFRSAQKEIVVAGRTLHLVIKEVSRVDEIHYESEGVHYVVEPKNDDNTLLVVDTSIINQMSSMALLQVDSNAAFVRDENDHEYEPIDPFNQRKSIPEPLDPKRQKYLPFLWSRIPGDFQLVKNTQIRGWLVFEVPKDQLIKVFSWEQADTIRVILNN